MRPIRPEELAEAKKKHIPEQMIEAFNFVIAKYWSGKASVVPQGEVIARFKAKCVEQHSTQRIIDEHWLDVEPLYMNEGWEVTYEKRGYNESGDSYFVFKPKKKQ